MLSGLAMVLVALVSSEGSQAAPQAKAFVDEEGDDRMGSDADPVGDEPLVQAAQSLRPHRLPTNKV